LLDQFREAFGIIEREAKDKGSVLITSEDGFGASLIIGFLMEARMLPFYEAYQCLSKRRYVIHVEPHHVQQLLEWEKTLHKEDIKQYFQCLCGACRWILLKPFDKTEQHQNPIPCNCELTDFSDCPNIGCGPFLESMRSRNQSFRDSVLKWGFTSRDNIQGNFGKCEEYNPWNEYSRESLDSSSTNVNSESDDNKFMKTKTDNENNTTSDIINSHSTSDNKEKEENTEKQKVTYSSKIWVVYRCRKCHFLTHALNQVQNYAIVTNINVTSQVLRENQKRKKKEQEEQRNCMDLDASQFL